MKRRPQRHPDGHERGQVLAFVGLLMFVLIGTVALTVDYGLMLSAKRSYQNAVDASVLVGAAWLQRPTTLELRQMARQETWAMLERELDLDPTVIDEVDWSTSDTRADTPREITMPDGLNYLIWVSTPPIGVGSVTDGAYPGSYDTADSRTIFARVSRQQPIFFGRILTGSAPDVTAWATAGVDPNRYAVITLRKNGDPTPGNPTNLEINGGTTLTVEDGDLGGNWGMSINGDGSQIHLQPEDAKVRLVEHLPGETGGNSWVDEQITQVIDGAITHPEVLEVGEVRDPDYPAPCNGAITYGVAPGTGTCLMDRGSLNIASSSPSQRDGEECPDETAVRLGSGRYHNLTLRNGTCAILDPEEAPVSGKMNGIYYFTGTVDLNNDALLIGDGVTLVFDDTANLNMNAGATISLNHGTECDDVPTCKFGAWTTGGRLNWESGADPDYTLPTDPNDRGMAIYVLKPSSPSTSILQMSSGSGIDFRGIVYAPWDNVKLSGQPNHRDIGQTICWTLMLGGGVEFHQTFDGPGDERPTLLEPTVGQ